MNNQTGIEPLSCPLCRSVQIEIYNANISCRQCKVNIQYRRRLGETMLDAQRRALKAWNRREGKEQE